MIVVGNCTYLHVLRDIDINMRTESMKSSYSFHSNLTGKTRERLEIMEIRAILKVCIMQPTRPPNASSVHMKSINIDDEMLSSVSANYTHADSYRNELEYYTIERRKE